MLLHEPARHETLRPIRWDENAAWRAIERIVADAEGHFAEERYWPLHPLDAQGVDRSEPFETSLYDGAAGVCWGLHYLQSVGACGLKRRYDQDLERLLVDNSRALGSSVLRNRASFLIGNTPILMMASQEAPASEHETLLAELIAGNTDHPARELMLGSPGTSLAALLLHERTGNAPWADLFRLTAAKLWSQLEWSSEHECAYWRQHLFGRDTTYLDAVHGFVAMALPLIRGRHLLEVSAWDDWQRAIVNTVDRTADRLGGHANWRPELLDTNRGQKKLVQFCHGAPGFIICLAGMPGAALDELLLAAGETVWAAGPLVKGSNLCHGTGGNGYAFLKLYERTRDSRWLDRARSFAMHGIAQSDEAVRRYGHARFSLWTGDVGYAIYLWDCVRAVAQFPTLDVFYPPRPSKLEASAVANARGIAPR